MRESNVARRTVYGSDQQDFIGSDLRLIKIYVDGLDLDANYYDDKTMINC